MNIQDKLDLLNTLEVVEYEGGDTHSVYVRFNDNAQNTLLELGFSEETIAKSVDEFGEKIIDLVPFASDLTCESWEYCGGFASNMILHTQQALSHLLQGSRIKSRVTDETYALEDMEGYDLMFTLSQLSGLWEVVYSEQDFLDRIGGKDK